MTQARNKVVKQAKAICRRDGQGAAFEVALQQALADLEGDIDEIADNLRGLDDGALEGRAQDLGQLLNEQISKYLKFDEDLRETGDQPSAGEKKTIPVSPPEWWESYSRRMLSLLDDLQRQALYALNRPGASRDLGRSSYAEFFGKALPFSRTQSPPWSCSANAGCQRRRGGAAGRKKIVS